MELTILSLTVLYNNTLTPSIRTIREITTLVLLYITASFPCIGKRHKLVTIHVEWSVAVA